MGLISPVKALDRLIRAIALVDNVELNIFGQPAMGYEAYGESVRMLVANLGVERRVTFKGFVREEEKESAFHGADVCVVPSHSENFSNVVAEALAHAVPVIVSKGAPWSRIEDKRCGLWVDNDPESLAEALIQIRSMDLGAMGVRGREWVRAEYSWNLVGRRIFDEYLSLVSHS